MTDFVFGNMTAALIGALIAFGLTVILGFPAIPLLRKLKAGQSIREEGPESHKAKAGTPTMGGIFMLIAVVAASVIVSGFYGDGVMPVLLFGLLSFGVIGFTDDYIKVVLKRNLGLTEKQKMGLQIIAAVVLVILAVKLTPTTTEVFIPFANVTADFGWFFYPFMVFVIVAVVNSVNLTDGLDGLASGVTIPVALFFAVTATGFGFKATGVFAAAVMGACAGFLIHNHKPAKVFMGDTGSLALGGAISAIAIVSNTSLIVPIVCLLFVAECLSVIIQVTVFKKTGKRVFKMSPLHHHFELSGWSEVKVVCVFSMVSVILCVIGAVILW